MSRSEEIEASPAELALIDLLYSDLEGPAAAAARAKVEAAPELTTAESDYRALRALMSELPDEDPPAAITAQLLHAAAAKAPTAHPLGESVGLRAWFKNFFRPLVMHPAMAAAATFALVAGVAGTLYLRGDVEVSQPRPADYLAVAPLEEAELDEVTAAAPAGGAVDLPSSRFDEDIVVDGTIARDQPELAKEHRAGAGGVVSTDKKKAGKVRRRPAMKSPRPDPKPPVDGFADEAGYLGQDNSDRVTKKPTARPAKQAPQKGPEVTGSAGQVIVVDSEPPPLKSMDDEGESKRDKEELAAAAVWHQKAIKAAIDGECDAVIDIGKRIRKLDSRYYDTSYLTDKRLRACLRPAKK